MTDRQTRTDAMEFVTI